MASLVLTHGHRKNLMSCAVSVRCALSADNHLAEVFVDGVAVRWDGNSGTKASWVSTISFNVGCLPSPATWATQ